LGEPARQMSPTRNRSLLPGTALLRAWRPTWTNFRDPVRLGTACVRIRGGSLGSDWCVPVRGVMRVRGSVGGAPRHAPARSGRRREEGLLVPRWTGWTGQRAATRTRRIGSGSRRLPARHHRPPSPGDVLWSRWMLRNRKASRVGLNRSQRSGGVVARAGLVLLVILARPRRAWCDTAPLACDFGSLAGPWIRS
jgi:hypothetical protein